MSSLKSTTTSVKNVFQPRLKISILSEAKISLLSQWGSSLFTLTRKNHFHWKPKEFFLQVKILFRLQLSYNALFCSFDNPCEYKSSVFLEYILQYIYTFFHKNWVLYFLCCPASLCYITVYVSYLQLPLWYQCGWKNHFLLKHRRISWEVLLLTCHDSRTLKKYIQL